MTAIRALSSMAQGLLHVEGIDFLSLPRFVDIQVRVPLDGQRDGSKAAGQVVEQILRRVKEVRDHDRALQPGAVYSYFSESAEAEACRPKSVREVFDGYSSTGRPTFTDFVTMAIERKDPGIDELLDGQDVAITHVSMGRVLRTQQLTEFGKGSPVYRILGQVDAGLYPLINDDKKAAFSFQLLRGATLEGRPRLRVHPVGAAEVMDVADPSVAHILSRFQQRLDQESLRLAGKLANETEVDEEEFALPLLQDLARQLTGRARRKSRRTKHADERAQEGQRPTTKAWEDAQAAGDDRLLWDDREGTVVVLGPRGRVHVFTKAARHVTSLVMQGSAINKRVQQGPWRQAEPEERGEFRMAVRRQARRAEEEAEAEAAAAAAKAASEAAAPTDSVPTDSAPADGAPADTAPADTAPADTAPADTAPADIGSSEPVPAEGDGASSALDPDRTDAEGADPSASDGAATDASDGGLQQGGDGQEVDQRP
ncbi:MAG: hypothetical protein AAF628_01305 [Planctomycetota bacterium]